MNASIATAIRANHPQDAVRIFHDFKSSRGRPDAITCSLLLKATGPEQWQQVLDYLAQLQTSGAYQDLILYSSFISWLTRSEQWQAALQVFDELPLQRLSPDIGVFAAAFMACRRGACWERSLSLLEEAERQEVSLDDVSRNGIVSALVSGGHVQMALKQAESASNFNSILMALCRNEMDLPAWTWTLQVLEKMRASNMTPNLGTFKAAASASKSRPDMVLPIFRNLKKHFALEILDGTALNMLLSSLEKCHRWQDALFHLRTFSCTSLKRLPDLAAYNSAISACAKVARWTLALSIAAEIGSNEWDKITLGSLVLACQTGRWTLALWLLEQGRLQHIQPNQIAIHSAIVACGGRHWPWAIHLLEESTAQRVVPDASMLGAVISSCEKGHQWSRCLHLLSTAFGMQCPPDIAALTSSISACAKAHRWEATLQLVREARIRSKSLWKCCESLGDMF